MREILIISGKGGTGKTSLTAAFAASVDNSIICDLDVDAPDLHLILQPEHIETHEFWSGHIAKIEPSQCTQCGRCVELCRFDAIAMPDEWPAINPLKCEGCKACVAMCPAGAIDFYPKQCGTWYISDTRLGIMVHAQLFPAEENSGRLVALLRKEAKALAEAKACDLILCDGPPGIGCPVISSLSDIDLAVIVTEPTPSGLHDLERAIGLCEHFQIRINVIINKWDLSPQLSRKIQAHCRQKGITVAARLPHDPAFTQALVQRRTVIEHGPSELAEQIRQAWNRITEQVLLKHTDCAVGGAATT